MCSSRKNPYPPHGRSLEIPRGRGILKVKILEAEYEAKLEFPGGMEVQNKKPSIGGVWIFSGTAQFPEGGGGGGHRKKTTHGFTDYTNGFNRYFIGYLEDIK